MGWSNGYITDLNYTFGYYSELNPANLRLACLCHGVEAHISEAPTYLELGFGQGVSINIHAAASDALYWGTDFNPSQTAAARTLATASGADVRLMDDSFAELAARTDLPDFDIIALHGIWSWVSEESRRVIKDIIRRKLRPGGIAYISYNCLPGWAPIIPIRRLMLLHKDMGEDNTSGAVDRVEGALGFARRVARAGSAYFSDNPVARHHLDAMTKLGRSYLAHEYLNADWHLEHFSDMASGLEDAKLTFVGSARLLDGLDAVQLDDEGRKLLAETGHPILRETVRDYLVNRRFRADVFVKGPRTLSGPEQRQAWLAQAFVLTKPSVDIPKKIPFGGGELELPTRRYDPILEVLSDDGYRLKTVGELLEHPTLRGRRPADLIDALTILTGAGLAGLAKVPSKAVAKRCKALNAYILQRTRVSMDLRYMASPITGGGIAVPHVVQLFILSLKEGSVDAAALARYVWDFLENVGERLVRNGSRIESKDETLKELEGAAVKFLRFEKPHIEALQLI